MTKIDETKCVFAVGQQANGLPLVLIGIPAQCWADVLRHGKTSHFDLSRVGIPGQVILFGGKDHDELMKILSTDMATEAIQHIDKRTQDFGIDDVAKEAMDAGLTFAQGVHGPGTALADISSETLKRLYRVMRDAEDQVIRDRSEAQVQARTETPQ